MGEKVLEIKNVYKGSLKSVSMEIEKGDFLAILAPSGSGKTTLLNLICGMESPASGKISVNGTDIGTIKNIDAWRAANIGYIFQENNLIPSLTVFENVELPMLAAALDKARRIERALRALENVGLKDKAFLLSKNLTIEEEQRTALARAMAAGPCMILADEPAGRLTKLETEGLIGLMKGLNKQTGQTFVVATHDNSIKSAASRVFEL